MRKTLIIAALASAAALAFPAAAQPERGRGSGYQDGYQQSRNIEQQLRAYDANIRNGIRLGRLAPGQGNRLLRQLGGIREMFYDYRRGGLSPREQVELRDRLNAFQGRLASLNQRDRRWEDRRDEDRRRGHGEGGRDRDDHNNDHHHDDDDE